MKRSPGMKRPRTPIVKHIELKKPFGFCCDFNYQDPDTQYDMRNPPYESAFQEEISCVINCPELKFRLQDVAKTVAPQTLRPGVYREDVEFKKAATYGRSKRGRKPLVWFLEDEIEAARDIIVERKIARLEEMEMRKARKIGKLFMILLILIILYNLICQAKNRNVKNHENPIHQKLKMKN